jgi:G3E family GTPase
MKKKPIVPATVLTGFLGAGKTSLLSHLLTQPHGYRCAIIINEFGSVGIDHQLVMSPDEEIIELSNGCLCCRVRGDLVKSIEELFAKGKKFDYILIETTGLADPSPISYTFFQENFADRVRLDAIVTVVDARHIEKSLDAAPEAAAQVAFADVLLLNKTDLVDEPALDRVTARLRRMNRLAQIHRTERSRIDAGKIFNVRSRDLAAPVIPVEAAPADPHCHDDHCSDPEHDHGHGCGHHDCEHDHDHGGPADHGHHDDKVKSFVITEDRPLDLKKTEGWLADLLGKSGEQIYRSKGILYIKGQAKRVVFQGVQMMFDSAPDRFWNPGEKRQSQLVVIGRDLDEAAIRQGFADCVAS